ncbi:MAG: adenylate/guanylate cyclase domain-containing protein [Spirochaetales bacterium]|nr:adenylate/guanylate cyclase domain-containing protein [Spirochaetales bacterium]
MGKKFPFTLEENPDELAGLSFWNADVYRDLLACQRGTMTEDEFDVKYGKKAAILILDMTGFTKSTLRISPLYSFFRILNAQKICLPVFREYGAYTIHAFADNFTAVFHEPSAAIDAACEIHRRIGCYYEIESESGEIAQCCIGIGYGKVYAIGADKAMGDEMNRASKLGEDIAKGSETLVTENVYNEAKNRPDLRFHLQTHDEVPFPFFTVTRKKKRKG